ncbi:retinol dehydrogenase [Acrasis kona]|uniref:Retinol dehydrogenase n=1 Tax=Acrasis kona TaxID=1008807 RepID=A0AAW2YNE5_9EUKA
MSKLFWLGSFGGVLAVLIFAARLYLLRASIPEEILNDQDRLKGKTTLITGATAGIGLATAESMYKMGSDLIICARDKARADEKIKQIKLSRPSKTGEPTIHFIPLDLMSLESVRNFVQEVKKLNVKLDYIINNAGATFLTPGVTNDGFEKTWQVNHLSHFLLTTSLLDTLNANSRIINLSSDAHLWASDYTPLTIKDVKSNMTDTWNKSYLGAYGLSKLSNILFTKELQKRVPADVYVVAVHPGFVATEISRELPSWLEPPVRLVESVLAKNTLQGAYTTLYTVLFDVEKGEYYADCEKANPSTVAINEEYARKLWELSEECVKQ